MSTSILEECTTTQLLSEYVKEKGISLNAIAKATGIPKDAVYRSLGSDSKRKLRAEEFLPICMFLEVDPLRFLPIRKAG